MGIRGHRSSRLIFRNKDHKEVHAKRYDPNGVMSISYPPNYPRNPIEKMYIENDECYGLVWEKTHDNQIIIPCLYYNGIGTTKGEPTPFIIHPKEPYVSYTYRMIGRPHNTDSQHLLYNNGSCAVRTKDFGIILTSVNMLGNLEQPEIYVSKDGIEWRKAQSILCTDVRSFSWGVDENVGIGFYADRRYIDGAWRENSWLKYELDDTGKLKTSFITSASNYNIAAGKIAYIGNGQFLNTDGEIYTAPFGDPGSNANIDIKYWNEKYYLFRATGPSANQSFEIIESTDGFKTISKQITISNDLIPSMFTVLGELNYFNDKLWLYVKGFIFTFDPETHYEKYYYGNYEPFFYIYEFDPEDISKTPIKHIGPHYMDFNFIGCQSYKKLTLMFDESIPPNLGDYNISIDSYSNYFVGYPMVVFPGIESFVVDNETIKSINVGDDDNHFICSYKFRNNITRACYGPQSTHNPDYRNMPYAMLFSKDGWPDHKQLRQWWRKVRGTGDNNGTSVVRPTNIDDKTCMTSLYFKDGAPADPYDFLCFGCRRAGGTGYDPWGDGDSLIMLVEGDLTGTPKSKYAFSSRNFMIDHYNETWRY